jgi:hypothetical protein
MNTECTQKTFVFQGLGRREMTAKFDGGTITSDSGGLLLREVEKKTGMIKQFSGCFKDYRKAELLEHSVYALVAQRVYGLALGYEDVNDHDELRMDPMMGILANVKDPTGQWRRRPEDKGKPIAGKSTLNRLELTQADTGPDHRYKKVVMDFEAVDRLLVDVFLKSHDPQPEQIILDVDATDDPLHGNQEGGFFHGYYREYCYLPLYIFCDDHLLCARLRPANIDGAEGALDELQRIIGQIRAQWPEVSIIIRGDSGFCRDPIMTWCEAEGIDYVLGMAKNARLERILAPTMDEAKVAYEQRGQASRIFHDFTYQTHKSWDCPRRVIGKAEYLAKGANPRFVVTSLSAEDQDARWIYEDVYCARGDMENRIKEQQLYLFADRTSTATLRANQIRLYFSSIAYLLMSGLRRLGLTQTEMAHAQCDTIRLKLLKIGGQIRITVRRIWISLAEGYPYQPLFKAIYANLQRVTPLRC